MWRKGPLFISSLFLFFSRLQSIALIGVVICGSCEDMKRLHASHHLYTGMNIYIHRHMNLIILMFWVITCSKRTPTHVPSPTNSGVRDQLLLHIRPSPGLWHFFLLMWVGLSLGLCLSSISFTSFSTHWFVRFSKNKDEMGITSMQQWVLIWLKACSRHSGVLLFTCSILLFLLLIFPL